MQTGPLRCVQTESNKEMFIARNASMVSLDHSWIIFLIVASIGLLILARSEEEGLATFCA